jgi:hypothetical protein
METATEEILLVPSPNSYPEPPRPTQFGSTQPQDERSLRLFTADEYERMTELGILGEDERVELLKGVILAMSPKGDPHASATDFATRFFINLLDDRVIVRNQNPIRLDDESEPEPDIVLALPDARKYRYRKPVPKDVLLVIEVADSSLSFDRNTKAKLYAKAGIPQYLILNLNQDEVEDLRDPEPSGYRTKHTYARGESFNLVAFPECLIRVEDVLPPE